MICIKEGVAVMEDVDIKGASSENHCYRQLEKISQYINMLISNWSVSKDYDVFPGSKV